MSELPPDFLARLDIFMRVIVGSKSHINPVLNIVNAADGIYGVGWAAWSPNPIDDAWRAAKDLIGEQITIDMHQEEIEFFIQTFLLILAEMGKIDLDKILKDSKNEPDGKESPI